MTEERRRPTPLERLYLDGIDGVTEALLIRHAEQEVDPNGSVGESRDPPLSALGRQQALLVGEALSNVHLDALFSSGLRRALDTARAIGEHHGLEPQVIDDLREHEIFRDIPDDQRIESVLSRELLRALQARLITERSADAYPHSESSYEFRKRAINAVEQAIMSQRAERIAIVCHAGVINAYVSHVVKSPHDFLFGPDHTSVSAIAVGDGRRMLRRLNDAQHLSNNRPD
jgi:probable phosphoglycerate mutase